MTAIAAPAYRPHVSPALRSCLRTLVEARALERHGSDWLKLQDGGGWGVTASTMDELVRIGLATIDEATGGGRVARPTEAAIQRA